MAVIDTVYCTIQCVTVCASVKYASWENAALRMEVNPGSNFIVSIRKICDMV